MAYLAQSCKPTYITVCIIFIFYIRFIFSDWIKHHQLILVNTIKIVKMDIKFVSETVGGMKNIDIVKCIYRMYREELCSL